MNRSLSALVLTFLLLLAACTSGDRQLRLAQLEELERQNVADSLMTNDSLAQALADFFDRHGTPNERLRAHYILGRTYSDLGDAPRALTSYQDAVKSADTTASDCDYAKLSRVYGWISDIMYKQSLMKDYIENIDRSIQYAWRAGDTLQALTEKAHKVLAYDKMRMPDSAVVWFDEVFNEITHYAGISLASKYSLIPLKILLDRNEMKKAESLIHLYEQCSGYFDSTGNVQKGREQYYYIKGYYYNLKQQLDSAEFYFRKELHYGQSFFDQNSGAYGLANLFVQQHRYDSAAKYALYSYSMIDSVYAHKVANEVERATALFNYSRYQQKALHEQENAARERAGRTRLGYLLLFTLTALAVVIIVWRKKRKESLEAMRATLSELSGVQHELQQLQTQKDIYRQLISEKTEAISRLEDDLSSMQRQEDAFAERGRIIKQKSDELADLQSQNEELIRRIKADEGYICQIKEELEKQVKKNLLSEEEVESSLAESGLFPLLKRNRSLTSIEWAKVCMIVNDKLPKFSQLLFSSTELLDEEERKLCILFRLHRSQKEICTLMSMKQSNVSKHASKIMIKLFNKSGGGRMLEKYLENYC